jgi:cytoskeletal protein CcmA (bactofilin family)
MFGKKAQPPIKSLIAQGSRIEGNLKFTEGLRIDGELIGNTTASPDEPSILVISEAALVEGEVRADHIIINGTVRGPVHAKELLELQPKARIEGDVYYKALEMHQGAVIAGQLKPMEEGEKPLLKFRQNAPEPIPEQVAVLLPGQAQRSRYPRSNS